MTDSSCEFCTRANNRPREIVVKSKAIYMLSWFAEEEAHEKSGCEAFAYELEQRKLVRQRHEECDRILTNRWPAAVFSRDPKEQKLALQREDERSQQIYEQMSKLSEEQLNEE